MRKDPVPENIIKSLNPGIPKATDPSRSASQLHRVYGNIEISANVALGGNMKRGRDKMGKWQRKRKKGEKREK